MPMIYTVLELCNTSTLWITMTENITEKSPIELLHEELDSAKDSDGFYCYETIRHSPLFSWFQNTPQWVVPISLHVGEKTRRGAFSVVLMVWLKEEKRSTHALKEIYFEALNSHSVRSLVEWYGKASRRFYEELEGLERRFGISKNMS